ncbi:MAG: PQQ-dependent sugar dehydrogenase, partial [bacterium]
QGGQGGQGGKQTGKQPGRGGAAVSASKLWEDHCARCHAEDGAGGVVEGKGVKSLLGDELLHPDHDRRMFDVIRGGSAEMGKAEFADKFTPQQAWALVVHIRELQERARRKRQPGPTPKAPAERVFSTQRASCVVQTVVGTGLETPWAVDFLPAGKGPEGFAGGMLITEKEGRLRVFANGKLSEPVEGVPKVWAQGQGGLLDVAVHPDYANSGWIYLAFSQPFAERDNNAATTTVIRGKLSKQGDGLALTDQQTIFRARPEQALRAGLHFGCRIVFDPADASGKRKGFTYICIGEHGSGNHAQELGRPNGKVHRVTDDGQVPGDNPFVGVDKAYETIWSYGHRNPQGMVFDLQGRLWVTEHAPRGGDELNLVERGANYGWPIVGHGINYSDMPLSTPWPEFAPAAKDKQLTPPVWRWLPSTAVCGLDVARAGPAGEAFAGWRGDLLAGGLAGQTVRRVRIAAGMVVEV